MKIKSLVFLLFFVLSCLSISKAQNNHDKEYKHIVAEANNFFETDDFRNAEIKYQSVWQKDTANDNVNFNLAVCKYRLKELPDSVMFFLQRADKSKDIEVQYYEGKIYHLMHQFDKAIEHFNAYKSTKEMNRKIGDMEIDRLISISKRAAEMMDSPHKASIKNIGSSINTKYDEYVPLVSTDEMTMYFTSRRPGGVGNKTDAWGKYYEDVYVSNVKNGAWQSPLNIGPPVNTETHDACVAVSADLQQMIVYRTSEDGTSGDLYHTEQTEKGWGPLVKFGPEINSPYRELSATFSVDNNTIFFSSDRPGGFGGKDLYRTVRLPNGQWSLPLNLGPKINTPYDEDAPFLHVDGKTLFFSSKGHETMGEYDIFKSEILDNNNYTPPVNLGYPVNSVGEDIFFVLSPDGRHGYYSSLNEHPEEEGYESEDIYYIDMRYSDDDLKVRKGLSIDGEDAKPLPAKITLINTESNKVEGVYNTSANTGKFVFIVNPFYAYRMIIDVKGYQSDMVEIRPMIEESMDADDFPELVLKLKKN